MLDDARGLALSTDAPQIVALFDATHVRKSGCAKAANG